MPSLFWRWKKERAVPLPSRVVHSVSMDDSREDSLIERKIHPDINSLAEELTSSQGHGRDSYDKGFLDDALEAPQAGFVGLKPRTRSSILQKETYSTPRGPGTEPKSTHVDAYSQNKRCVQKEFNAQESAANIPSLLLSAIPPGDELVGYAMPSISSWSPFRKRAQKRQREIDANEGSASRSTSPSSRSGSQSQSRSTSRSRVQCSENEPQTPGFQSQSFSATTPHSRSSSSKNFERDTFPSPHTFGMPTPPIGTYSSANDSFFNFTEIPPPLPPLNHPAFRQNNFSLSLNKDTFPILQEQHANLEKFTRHTHSLPSLKRAKSAMRKMPDRPRSNSIGVNKKEDIPLSEPQAPSSKRFHTRSQSKSSIASSRRSSAEYSAKQVSSIGHDHVYDGCWEVQVSKEMVKLALREVQREEAETKTTQRQRRVQDAPISSLGQAHRWTGEAARLGSPIILQDTLHNLKDRQSEASLNSNSEHRVASYPAEFLRKKVMSYGDFTMSTSSSSGTSSSKKGKEAIGGPSSSSNSHPRRLGRASSTPSNTRTPSPPPSKLTTETLFSSIQDPALLGLPTLSVTAPTPQISPITPTNRTTHKSLPSSSVLRSPTMPTVKEKNYSSGSTKRKAEAEGDKTPPKDHKEPRATFAPEPRGHRASATSSTSAHAPSSFNHSKRVRLTDTSEGRASSRSGSTPNDSPPRGQNAKTTGSWSSRGSQGPLSMSSHTYGGPPPAPSASHASYSQHQRPSSSRRSLSQASIPISALISPHAPSISKSSTFHMRDPRKPNPIQGTPWSLSFPSQVDAGESRWSLRGWVERGGSPLHSWLFFIGFILFPLWWAAALFIPIPRTRQLGGTDAEKGVILDDPQVEHDAKSWRTRCRFMAGVSLFTYIPFIVLVAIYA